MDGMGFEGMKGNQESFNIFEERKWMIKNKEQLRILYCSNQDVQTSETRAVKNSLLITSLEKNIWNNCNLKSEYI